MRLSEPFFFEKTQDELTLIATPRTDTNRSLLLTNSLNDCIYDSQPKSTSILDISSIFVCPGIADVLEELVDQVSVRSMDLDSIEPCADRVLSSLRVHLDVFVDFGNSESTRCRGIGRAGG
jgi:hypothetical protein